jgi:SAM-dependent MidA family methyltransferase
MPDGRILFIHRGQYGEDISKEKLDHPAWKNYLQAVSKVLLYNPSQVINTNDNVVHVDFNQ